MRRFLRKRITSPAAFSPGFIGRLCSSRSRLTTAAAWSPNPSQTQPHASATPAQLPLPGRPQPQQSKQYLRPGQQNFLTTPFDASQVTPLYRTKELEGMTGIQGVGPQTVAALKKIGITSKGELLYLYGVVCNGCMGTTSSFLRVRSLGLVWVSEI